MYFAILFFKYKIMIKNKIIEINIKISLNFLVIKFSRMRILKLLKL